jgi:FkbM family methyltransferase
MKKNICVYVGGFIGSSALGLVKKFDEIHIFEPNPIAFEQLKVNLKEFKDKIYLVNAACDTADGVSKFYVTKNLVSSSLGLPLDSANVADDVQNVLLVQTINLLDYLKRNNVEYLNFLVIDAQGADLAILSTIKEMLDKQLVYQIMVETHSDTAKLYGGLNNRFSDFISLLQNNYDIDFYLIDMCLKSSSYQFTNGEVEWDTVWTAKNEPADLILKWVAWPSQNTGVLADLREIREQYPEISIEEYLKQI